MNYRIRYRIKIKIQRILNSIFHFFGFVLSEKKLTHQEIIKKILKINSNPIIFDIGANNGQYIKKCQKIYSNPTIYSFEPQFSEYNNLIKKFSNNSNIKIFQKAIGSKKDKLKLKVNNRTQSSGFYKFQKDFKFKNFENENISYLPDEIVEVTTVDDFCEANSINQIDVLKIDTECHEDHVLIGSIQMLKEMKVKILDIEIIIGKIYEKRLSFYEIEKILHPLNYRLFSIDNKGNRIDKKHLLFNVLYVSNEIDNLY